MSSENRVKWDILEELSGVKSIAQLETLVGEISPEEQRLVIDAKVSAEPTEEELAEIGPEFTERLVSLTLARLGAPTEAC
jgi:hypothetical protein